jgi:hypothetical protein
LAAHDPFVGTWILDSAQSLYEFGTPPQSGIYRIEPNQTGYLVTMEWVDAEGKDFRQMYTGVPDGGEYPYGDVSASPSMSMTRVDERTLDSSAFKDGKRIAYGRRVLSEDGKDMTVVQSGTSPEGIEFNNFTVYRKQP